MYATAPRTCSPSPASRQPLEGLVRNPLERLNKEIKRRTDVVGVFPQPRRLAAPERAVLVEAHDEWQISDRRYLSKSSMALLTATTKEVAPAQLMPA